MHCLCCCLSCFAKVSCLLISINSVTNTKYKLLTYFVPEEYKNARKILTE